jgi:TilS substrate C-terminal domain
MTGHKKLSDVFIDRRVPFRRRAASIVVEKNGRIVWVPGVVAAEDARIEAGAPGAVRLSARPADEEGA